MAPKTEDPLTEHQRAVAVATSVSNSNKVPFHGKAHPACLHVNECLLIAPSRHHIQKSWIS